jgi:hypothetical protein
MIVPIFVRWKLGNASWGTFFVYAVFLSFALMFQGTWQSLFDRYILAAIFFSLSVVSFCLAVYFFCKNYFHVKNLVGNLRR